MRSRYEFCLHAISAEQAALKSVEPTLALLGSQGWEIRGLAPLTDGSLVAALQRPLDEEAPLAGADALSARLSEPLVAPPEEQLVLESRSAADDQAHN
jgi:hypothetical protein